MVISTEFLNKKNELDLERLPMNEAHTDSLELLSLVENAQYNKIVLNLESALSYCEKNDIGLDQLVSAVSKHYFIDEECLAFSVQPSSIYLNEDIENIVKSFSEAGIPYLLTYNPESMESKLVTAVCTEAERLESAEVIDILSEGFFGTLRDRMNNITTGAGRGLAQGLAHGTARVVGGVANSAAEGIRQGAVRGGEKFINNQIFGKLDTEVPDTDENGNIKTDSSGKTIMKKVENGRVQNWINNQTTNQTIRDAVMSLTKSVRGQVSSDAMNKLQSLVGLKPGQPINVGNLIDSITRRIGYFGNRLAEGKGDPQKRTLFQQIIDKLKSLRDKLLAKFRGPRPAAY